MVFRFLCVKTAKHLDNLVKFRKLSNVKSRKFSNLIRLSRPPPRVFISLTDDAVGQPYNISEREEALITEEDPEARIKLQETLLLLYLKRHQGEELPHSISIEEFKVLIKLRPAEVDTWLNICCVRRFNETIKAKENSLNAEILSLKMHQESLCPDNYRYLNYGEDQNSLFHAVMKHYRSHFYNTNLGKGLMFGQDIVFDCSFEDQTSELEFMSIATEINSCISLNRRNRRPFAIHFCNMKSNDRLLRHLKKRNPKIGLDLPVHLHECSYLKLFERERIVYLSPFVRKELEYHPDDVYILGALDKKKQLLSLKKARFEQVRCAHLPIGFKQIMEGNAVLDLFESFRKLLTKKNTGHWTMKGHTAGKPP